MCRIVSLSRIDKFSPSIILSTALEVNSFRPNSTTQFMILAVQYITNVPALMLSLAYASVHLIMSMSFSYNGTPRTSLPNMKAGDSCGA